MGNPVRLEWRIDQVSQEFLELRKNIDQLPLYLRMKLMPLCDRVGHVSRLQNKLVRIAQDAVDQLQLDLKYLIFDLEVTRKEKEELRQRLQTLEEEFEGES